jgi:ketosteroid isomerase-like protein
VKAALAEDGTVPDFEVDLDGKPVRLATRADAVKFVDDTFTALQGMNATIAIDIRSLDCHAVAELAYCSMQHDVSAKMPDGTTMAQPSRASIVLRKGSNGWQWTHWHTSLATMPAPPPTPK